MQNLTILRKEYNTKAIHDLRVAVKKLRSYLKWLELLVNKLDAEKDFEKTEHLFAVLGKHRDIEIGLLLLQAFEKTNNATYTAFRFQLKIALQRSEIWVKDALNKYDEKGLVQLTGKLQQSLKETDTGKLLNNAKASVDKQMKKLKQDANDFSGEPHAMRKSLKNIFYWIESSPKNMLTTAMELNKLKKSLDGLGDWQDLEMLCEKIKHFRKDFVPDAREEYVLLKNLEKNIKDKMEIKLRRAEDNFKEFMMV